MTDYKFRQQGTIKHSIISFDYDIEVDTNSPTFLKFLDDGIDKLIDEYCRKNHYKKEIGR